MKSALKILIVLIVLSGQALADTAYYGTDAVAGHVAKVTMSNMALYSEQFDNAAWTKSTGVTGATANTVVAPDGTTTADTITLASITTSGRYIYPTSVIVVGNTSTRREYFYIKAGTHAFVQVYSQFPATAYVDVNLTTCAILRTGTTNITSFSTSVGNGWCLIGFTHTPNNNNASPTITPLKDASTVAGTSWTSAGTETFYVWGGLVNLASSPEDYLLTTTVATTLGPLCAKGFSQSHIDPSKCYPVTASAPSVTIATGGLTAASVATGAFDADALATDAVEEIREGILTRVVEGNYGATTIGGYIERIKNYVANKMVKSGSTYTIYKNDESTTYATGTTNGAGRDPS